MGGRGGESVVEVIDRGVDLVAFVGVAATDGR